MPRKPTIKQKRVAKILSENVRKPLGQAMREAGYSQRTSEAPQRLTKSKGWDELMKEFLPDDLIATKHHELLNSTEMDHMIFPLGPGDEDDTDDEDDDEESDSPRELQERTSLTDQEIIDMLAEVNCKVRRIVHGNTARHVYFWAADNLARDRALDKAYKLKGRYAAERVKIEDPIEGLSDEELREREKAIIAKLKKK